MKKNCAYLWAGAFMVCMSQPISVASAPAERNRENFDFRKGFSSVASFATPAVVFIQVEKQVGIGNFQHPFNNPFELFGEEFYKRFFGQPPGRQPIQPRRQQPNQQRQFRQTGQGSGFLVSEDGYILTNTHVVGDVDRIMVRLADGREFEAQKVGADARTEVAVIKIEAEGLPYLKAGDSENLAIGEWVIAIGNPFGLKETLTVGVVSAKGRSIGITDYEDFIQTDAAINPGNSGGPLLNIDGEVVGINTAIFSRSGGHMGIGFAVPIDMAMNIKGQFVTKGRVTRGYIGIMMNPGEMDEAMAQSFGRQEKGGVLIADVQKGGPADQAGLKSGDIILELNGKKVLDNTSFRREVAQILPNKKAELVIFRDGKTRKVTVTVGALPDEPGEVAAPEAETGAWERTGLQVQDLTRELAERLGFEADRGVIISEVAPGSNAHEAGLSPGMLIIEANRRNVNSVREFEEAVKQTESGNILLRIRTERGTLFVNLRLTD